MGGAVMDGQIGEILTIALVVLSPLWTYALAAVCSRATKKD